MNFDHVENKNLRNLLVNGWDGDEDSICQALTYSADCMAEDLHNELLDERIVEQRARELGDAEFCWNEEGDGFEAVECLRSLWSI